MDIQYVLDAYACVMYVASYVMKTEKAMGALLRTEELKKQLRKVGSVFLNHREVSAQEAAYRILSLPVKKLSREVVFINTNDKKERIAVLKIPEQIRTLDEDDIDAFQKTLIDRYQHRPVQISDTCLAEFTATYSTEYKPNNDEVSNDALDDECEVSGNKANIITLTDGYGTMRERRNKLS